MKLIIHLSALALAAAAAVPSSAQACSPALHCRNLVGVLPADDATDVPRNTELRIVYSGATQFELGASATLETDDGTVVPTTWERVQLHGFGVSQQWIGHVDQPLAASTHYRLRHSFSACSQTDAGSSPSETCGGLCKVAEGDVISEFTTGTTTNDATPASIALGVPAESSFDSCDNSACCGPYARCLRTIEVPALPEGQLLRITRGSTLVGYFGGGRGLRVASPASGGYGGFVDISGAGTYQVRVVDETGNQSAESTFGIPACDGPGDGGVPTDAGTDASVQADASVKADASVGTDGGAAKPSNDDDGCALASGRTAWTSALWIALALVVARRRRVA